MSKERYIIISLDAGGTMTDTFIVDEKGDFTDGKAMTTPWDESIGVLESISDAVSYWGVDLRDILSKALIVIYSGTTMLNTLLTRTGSKVGLIITKGFEDYVLMERGLVWLGYSYYDRLHTVTHVHNEPLVPRNMVRGVTERIDMFGDIIVPLNEDEVKQAVEYFINSGVESIAIMFIFSYINPAHEIRAAEIARSIIKEQGLDISVVISSEVAPIMREYSRLNSVLIQAYASETTRKHLLKIENSLKNNGYKRNLLIMTSYGSLTDIRYPRLYESLISGPIGGMLGARYVGNILGIKDIVCADMGGTSFDVGIITKGVIPIIREPDIARFRLNLPMALMDSIGAGTGTVIKVNPVTKRIDLGPESASALVGMCYKYNKPTISDCDVVLGYLNPDYFLGGKIKLNEKSAYKGIKEYVADILDLDVYEAAWGIIDLLNTKMRSHIYAMLLGRGYNPSDYIIMVYGGGGPLHMWGFTKDIPFKSILTFPFAAVFSAFGIATADYAHRYHKSILALIPPGEDEPSMLMRAAAMASINEAWEELEGKALNEFETEGIPEDDVKFTHYLYVRYYGQLEDVEVPSPVTRLESMEDLERAISEFEKVYETIYPEAAKYPEAGYLIAEVGLVAYVKTTKPRLPKFELESSRPPENAFKGEREVYYDNKWIDFEIWEMGRLRAGNEVRGPAIIEHPTTTLVIPPGYKVKFDEYRFIWYSRDRGG